VEITSEPRSRSQKSPAKTINPCYPAPKKNQKKFRKKAFSLNFGINKKSKKEVSFYLKRFFVI
jgi:hypothetical protein